VVDVAFFLLLVLISFAIVATQLFGLTRFLYSYSSDEHINYRSMHPHRQRGRHKRRTRSRTHAWKHASTYILASSPTSVS
jgi:hypothetical protein